ncbi:hypothetical protein EON81_10740 [bacterium]|nr:MAG: hypothetical protein EON81_10740 [bacterium]
MRKPPAEKEASAESGHVEVQVLFADVRPGGFGRPVDPEIAAIGAGQTQDDPEKESDAEPASI